MIEIQSDIKEMKSDIGAIKVTLERNTVSLEQHMKRTELNEQRIKSVEYWLLGLLGAVVVALVSSRLH